MYCLRVITRGCTVICTASPSISAWIRHEAPLGSSHLNVPSSTPAAMTSVSASFQRRSSLRETLSSSGLRSDSDQPSIHIAHALEPPVGANSFRMRRSRSSGVAEDRLTVSRRARSCSAA